MARPTKIIKMGMKRFCPKTGMVRPKYPATMTAPKMKKPRATSNPPGFSFLLSSLISQFNQIRTW